MSRKKRRLGGLRKSDGGRHPLRPCIMCKRSHRNPQPFCSSRCHGNYSKSVERRGKGRTYQ